jgi:hypothetical protein
VSSSQQANRASPPPGSVTIPQQRHRLAVDRELPGACLPNHQGRSASLGIETAGQHALYPTSLRPFEPHD